MKRAISSDDTESQFQEDLKAHFQVPYCFLISSGKAALTIILVALSKHDPERTEVIIPAYTCYSVPSAIVRAGLKVRPCDIDLKTFNFQLESLDEILDKDGDKILAIVPTHLFGLPVDIRPLRKRIKGRQIRIIEDAAQAMGARSAEGRAGTNGDVSFFSTGRGKPFSTVEGGIILCSRREMAEMIQPQVEALPAYSPLDVIKLLCYAVVLSIFSRPALFGLPASMKFLKIGETIFDTSFPIRRMSSFQAGLAMRWRSKLKYLRDIRAENASRWINLLKERGVPIPSAILSGYGNLIRFPLLLESNENRAGLIECSDAKGLGIKTLYPDAVNGIDQLSNALAGKLFPNANRMARTLVTLPIHPYVSSTDRRRIETILKKYL